MTVLTLYTIYCSPLDYPGEYVARRHFVDKSGSRPDTVLFARGDTLEAVRAALPADVAWLVGREPGDEPQIVETWI